MIQIETSYSYCQYLVAYKYGYSGDWEKLLEKEPHSESDLYFELAKLYAQCKVNEAKGIKSIPEEYSLINLLQNIK